MPAAWLILKTESQAPLCLNYINIQHPVFIAKPSKMSWRYKMVMVLRLDVWRNSHAKIIAFTLNSYCEKHFGLVRVRFILWCGFSKITFDLGIFLNFFSYATGCFMNMTLKVIPQLPTSILCYCKCWIKPFWYHFNCTQAKQFAINSMVFSS